MNRCSATLERREIIGIRRRHIVIVDPDRLAKEIRSMAANVRLSSWSRTIQPGRGDRHGAARRRPGVEARSDGGDEAMRWSMSSSPRLVSTS